MLIRRKALTTSTRITQLWDKDMVVPCEIRRLIHCCVDVAILRKSRSSMIVNSFPRPLAVW
jgi:hypothetical protein